MFCSKCGAQLNEGAKFCTVCGTAVPQQAEPPQPSENETQILQQAEPQQEKQPVSQPVQEEQKTPQQPVAQTVPQPNTQSYQQPAAQTVPQPNAQSYQQPAAQPKSKKTGKIIIGAVAALLIIIILIAVIGSKGSGDENTDSNNTSSVSDFTSPSSSEDNNPAITDDTTAQPTDTTASAGQFYSDADFDKGNVEEDEDGYVNGTYDNPKALSDPSIIINGVKITLPIKMSEFTEKTGFALELPDNQLQGSAYTFIDASKGEDYVTLDIVNYDSNPKAYKDCEIRHIYVHGYDVQASEISLPCGIKMGEKANLNGIINTLGNPHYYGYLEKPENCSVYYNLDTSEYAEIEIELDNNSVSYISVDISH